MDSKAFVQELEAANRRMLAKLRSAEDAASGAAADMKQMLQVALNNEINVSELAALWMPTTPELDVKLALAQQAGDEADHFTMVEHRLRAMGITADFTPAANPLFAYLRGLQTTIEKIAAGQFTLESIAYQANESFMNYCARAGEAEIVKLYQERIQPDELHHHHLGQKLLEKYAVTPEAQELARRAAAKTLEIALQTRQMTAQKLGTSCFPGC